MKPLTIIYWTRAVLGLVIGVLCGAYVYFSVTSELTSLYTLLSGLSFAMLFYVATHYVIKFRFGGKVEKQSRLMFQGIGIYFFAWIVSWALVVTLLMPSASVSVYVGGELPANQKFWVAAWNGADHVVQNVTTSTGTLRMALLPPDTYTFQLGGNLTGYVVVDQNQTVAVGWLEPASVVFNVTQSPA